MNQHTSLPLIITSTFPPQMRSVPPPPPIPPTPPKKGGGKGLLPFYNGLIVFDQNDFLQRYVWRYKDYDMRALSQHSGPVSYTHLTLPTRRTV